MMQPLELLPQGQSAFYSFISDYAARTGAMPTYRECMQAMGYSSPNSVTQNLKALLKKGYLFKGAGGGYAMALPGVCPCCRRALKPSTDNGTTAKRPAMGGYAAPPV